MKSALSYSKDETADDSLAIIRPFLRKSNNQLTGSTECDKIRVTKFTEKAMLSRNLGGGDQNLVNHWRDLGHGAATIIGFANLCGSAMSRPANSLDENSEAAGQLSSEAKAILIAAANRGTIEIRADQDSFNSAERFLAVCVEYELEQRMLFLDKENPEQTIRFLDGFRELCQNGLVFHHLQKDFSLSTYGFAVAKTLDRDEFTSLLSFGSKIEH